MDSWLAEKEPCEEFRTFADIRPQQCLTKTCQKTPGNKGAHWHVQEAAEQPQKTEQVQDGTTRIRIIGASAVF